MDNARRHVALMIVPLAVMALGAIAAVFVPYGYPLKWLPVATLITDPSPFLAIHAGAGLLAVQIALASRRDTPPGHLATVVAILTILAATVMTAISVKYFADGGAWTPVLVFVAPVALALVLAFNALRMRGWDRMLILCGALAIAALPFSCPLIPGMFNLFSGGILYLVADVTVLALFVRGLR